MASGDIQGDIIYRDKATKALTDVGKASDNTGKKFGGLTKGAALAGAAVAAMAVKIGKDAVDAYAAVQDATGAATVEFGKQAPLIAKFAENAAKNFGLSTRQALEAQNTFGTFGKAAGLTGKDLSGFAQQLTGLAGDLASFKGTSADQAITALGAAMRGENEPIQAYGVLLNDATMRQEALKLGLVETTKEALTPQQKVLAAHALIMEKTTDAQGDYIRTSDSTANTLKTASAQFENLEVILGSKIAPAMVVVTSGAIAMAEWIERNKQIVGPLVVGLGAFAGAVLAINVAQKAWTATTAAWTVVTKLGAAAQAALNFVMEANPIGLVVIAVAALAAGLVLAYHKSETFREIVHGAMDGAREAIGWVVDAGRDLIGWFSKLPGWFVGMGKGLVNALTAPWRTAFHWIATAWNSTIGSLDFKVPSWVPEIGGKGWSVPNLPETIPALAQGGIVPATPGGRLVRVAEGGQAEAIVPLSRLQAAGGSFVWTGDLVVHGSVVQERDLARSIRDEIGQLIRRRGGDLGGLGLA